ncbi:MAG: hypothetical protein LBC76_02755 [Treponema sp.]|jgi:hypothetical protein|nr:hypothetical protein [Treponema sp.]
MKNKIRIKITLIITVLALGFMVPGYFYLSRSPVLIITDLAFISLYGEARIKQESLVSSFILFRRVRIVLVADDASDEIVRIAITDVSSNPFCVIFPLRFIRGARIYREQNPEIPVVILEGRHGNISTNFVIGSNLSDYYIYKTDINIEFQKAGMAAAAVNMGKNGKIAVFMDPQIQLQATDAFLQGMNFFENPPQALFFNNFIQFSEIPDLSCVVLAGSGVEFLENNEEIPIIFFSWIDPALLPAKTVLLINDSSVAQTIEAVRMVIAGQKEGLLQSKFVSLNKGYIDKKILRKIHK